MTDSAPRDRLRRRDWCLHLLLGCVATTLVIRLVDIQHFRQHEYLTKVLRQQVSEEVIPARPGDILDRAGRLLATTVSVPSLYIVPQRIDDPADFSARLASVVDLNPEMLQQRIERSPKKLFLWARRQLSGEEVDAVRQLGLDAQSYGFRTEFRRFYPQGNLAAHVLGLRDIDGVGRGGVEQSFDAMLRGEQGVRRYVRDARGRVLDVLEEVTEPPRDGVTMVLTLDVVIQLFVERMLDEAVAVHQPVSACAVVLDPQTGEVLALGSRPTFDPHNLGDVPDAAWKNTAIASVFEPGSTFKPFVISWALDRKLVTENEFFDCESGVYRMGPRVLHDHHPYGELSLTDVLVKSSNIGMAKIGEIVGNENLYRIATSFGFGQRTGIELPGELPGILHPLAEWTGYSTGSIPMGQELAATPMQVITAHAVLANGGRKVVPHLFRTTTSGPSGLRRNVQAPPVVGRARAEWMIQHALREVVKRGTGRRAQLPGISVFGKTGTAQKFDPRIGTYSRTQSVCSFVCGAPAENPRALVLVAVDEPHGEDPGGGSVAAPIAAEILDWTLQVYSSPDLRMTNRSARPLR